MKFLIIRFSSIGDIVLTTPVIRCLRKTVTDADIHYLTKKSFGKIPSFAFNKLNVEKWIFTNFKINMMPAKHIVDRYMETLRSFNVVNDGLGLDYFIPERDVGIKN